MKKTPGLGSRAGCVKKREEKGISGVGRQQAYGTPCLDTLPRVAGVLAAE